MTDGQMFHQAQLHDGRWVRMRELSSLDQERATAAAGITMGNGSVLVASVQRQNRELVKTALVAVSVSKPVTVDGPKGPDGKPTKVRFDPSGIKPEEWKPLAYGELETSFDALFGAKARVQLQRLYDRIHTLTDEDMDGFFGSIHSGVASS